MSCTVLQVTQYLCFGDLMNEPVLSVVVPLHNEAVGFPELARRLSIVLGGLGVEFEVLFVDDGSSDETSKLVLEMNRKDSRYHCIRLSRNFGHQQAITAGLENAIGKAIVVIDGDLQDPPETIPELVIRWREGADVVVAERRSRAREGILRDIGIRVFHPLFRPLSGQDVPSAGVFSLMDRRVLIHLNNLKEHHRFIPGLRDWIGFRREVVQYDRQPRNSGEPKQSMTRLIRYATEALFAFSTAPLRLAT